MKLCSELHDFSSKNLGLGNLAHTFVGVSKIMFYLKACVFGKILKTPEKKIKNIGENIFFPLFNKSSIPSLETMDFFGKR